MIFNKEYFDKLFENSDPWKYRASEYEKIKYTRQINAIRKYFPRPKKILEIGSAEGLHTQMLAKTFPKAEIVTVEISHNAISRAKKIIKVYRNVKFIEADIAELVKQDVLPEKEFDVIIQSESLYYLFTKLIIQMNLVNYFRTLIKTLKIKGIFVTSNGYGIPTKGIMEVYYMILSSLSIPIYKSKYKDWNELKKKYMTYDLRVFRRNKD